MNPFDLEHADPWTGDLVDVDSLNQEASDTIKDAVLAVRGHSVEQPDSLRAHSILVLGPAGAGKTHLFARLRRSLGPRAAFVLLRPELGAVAHPRQVLAMTMEALRRKVFAEGDQRQLDIVVGALFGAARGGTGQRFPHMVLEELGNLDEAAREEALEETLIFIENHFEEAELGWLETLLRTPFMRRPTQRAALSWLAGLELNARELKRVGYTERLSEERILPALRTLGIIASFGAPILLVFDQLENLVDGEDTTRVLAHAHLVAELFDTVRGMVVVQMALDGVWQRHVSPALTEAQRSRLERKLCFTRMPTTDERQALVTAWAAKLSEPEPFPWPLSPEDWTRIAGAAVMTPRMLMKACRDALLGESEVASDPGQHLQELWADGLERAQAAVERAAKEYGGVPLDRLASAIWALLALTDAEVEATSGRHDRHQWEVTTDEKRLIFVLQQTHHTSVAAALRRAIERGKKHPVIILRERSMPIPSGWKAVNELRQEVLRTGVWIDLELSRVQELIALHDFLAAARSQDLTLDDGTPVPAEMVRAWLRDEVGALTWPLSKRLLGQPTDEASPPAHTEPPLEALKDEAPALLAELGLASLERLMRELRAVGTPQSRQQVRRSLEALGDAVTWLSPELVYLRGAPR